MPTNRNDGVAQLVLGGILLVVLAALVGPALVPARGKGVFGPGVEIKMLEAAATAFQTRFGVLPPSRITLHEQPGRHPYDLEGTSLHARIAQQTVSFFQKAWPEFPILTGAFGKDDENEGWIDFNHNGRVDDELELDGPECLVFFLGGVLRTNTLIGFDDDRRNPLGNGMLRDGPFFKFHHQRLVDHDNDGFPEYVDPLPGQKTSYQYFSSGDGHGYELTLEERRSAPNRFIPYFSRGDPQRDPGNVEWYKPKSVQIISPGKAGRFGTGGLFRPDDTSNLSPQDADNLVNFHAGQLRP